MVYYIIVEMLLLDCVDECDLYLLKKVMILDNLKCLT